MTDKVNQLWSIDWQRSERKRAEFRIELRDLLEEFGFPPGECERAVKTVLEQAKLNAQHIDSDEEEE